MKRSRKVFEVFTAGHHGTPPGCHGQHLRSPLCIPRREHHRASAWNHCASAWKDIRTRSAHYRCRAVERGFGACAGLRRRDHHTLLPNPQNAWAPMYAVGFLRTCFGPSGAPSHHDRKLLAQVTEWLRNAGARKEGIQARLLIFDGTSEGPEPLTVLLPDPMKGPDIRMEGGVSPRARESPRRPYGLHAGSNITLDFRNRH